MKSEWSLSEAARLLRLPQHRLIYLCEKRVVSPDFGEAHGRGSSRRFSARNLLEFDVALKLRRLTVPASSIAAILYALRAFEAEVARRMPGFQLPGGLKSSAAPDLRAIVTDEGHLYFSLGADRGTTKVFGGIDFGRLVASRRTLRRSTAGRPRRLELRLPDVKNGLNTDGTKARVEISVTRIARDLDLGS